MVNIINKRKLSDLVTESMLLNEEGMYGCPESSGKIFGYNPITKKCVDITDYEGPDRPEKVKSSPEDESDDKKVVDKPGYDFDLEGLEELFDDTVQVLSSWDEMSRCFDDHPVASIGGIILGAGGQISIHYNGVAKTALLGAKGVAKVGLGAAKATAKTIGALGTIGSLAAAAGLYWFFREEGSTFEKGVKGFNKVSELNKDYDKFMFPDAMKALDKLVDDISAWTDINKGNLSCASAAILGSTALTYTIRKGAMPALRGTKALSRGVDNVLFGQTFSSYLGQALKKRVSKITTKTDQIPLFMAAKRAGKIDDAVKLTTRIVDGKPVIKITRIFPEVKIKLSDLPADMQKIYKKKAVNGEVTLDVTTLQRQLRAVSNDTVADVANRYQKEAGDAMSTSQGQNLKRIVNILGRQGDISPAALRNTFFKETGSMFDDLISKQGRQIEDLYTQLLDIKKLKKKINISDDVSNKFLKQRQRPEQYVEDLIKNNIIKDRSKSAAVDYFEKLSKASADEKQLTTQLTQIQNVLDQEKSIAKAFGENSKTNLKKEFLQTAESSKLIRFQNILRNKLPTFNEILRTSSFEDTARKLFFMTKVGGLGYAAYETMDFIQDSDKRIARKVIIPASQKFAKKITLGEYEKGQVTNRLIDSDQIFEDFYQIFSKSSSLESPSGRKAAEILKKFTSQIKASKEVENFFNAESKKDRTDDLIQQKFIKVIEAEFDTNDETTNEVYTMNKKDIRQLVAEVLNENSGQGYGKYPYHLNEPSEEEPNEDYMQEWSSLIDSVCDNKKKNIDGDPRTAEDMAIEVAKILIKDTDLFRDVLETAGSNKSIGVEIMQQLKAAMEKKTLDKELDV